MAEVKKNVHSGHRRRMRELVDRVGLENLNEIQALEFTLSYVIPRKDTNVIAHDLIEKFGSFANVFNAPVNELEKVDSIGKDSAKMISQLKDIFYYYKISKQKAKVKIDNILQLNLYFKNLLEDFEKEKMYVLAINNKNQIVATKCLAEGNNKFVSVEKRELANFAFTNKVNKIALGHNHPNASCTPSQLDDDHTAKIIGWLNSLGIQLVDHVIVGNDGTFSFKDVSVFTILELEKAE